MMLSRAFSRLAGVGAPAGGLWSSRAHSVAEGTGLCQVGGVFVGSVHSVTVR